MNEITPFAVQTTTIFLEIFTQLSFVFFVYLIIFEELMRTMSKFTPIFVRAEPKVHIATA
jgi:hypothetical protein